MKHQLMYTAYLRSSLVHPLCLEQQLPLPSIIAVHHPHPAPVRGEVVELVVDAPEIFSIKVLIQLHHGEIYTYTRPKIKMDAFSRM